MSSSVATLMDANEVGDSKHDKDSKVNHEGMTVTKSDNFSEWYRQIVTKVKFIEYYDVSGCYVILPNAYTIWEKIMNFLDSEFKKRDVRNAYFPLFITEKNLNREQTHIADFSPEVAWVTRSGKSELEEPIAVRPTSECAIYSVLPNMIRSYQDLPLKLNQWCNVVRWEFKDATPFIRSREFLWNEGHTIFSTQQEAQAEVDDIIRLYKETYRHVLCVPTILGRKTEKERFAGADATYTIEGFIPEVGRGIQAATAHCLGQNFSKMFGIKFQDSDQETKYAYQNSWGFTTRSIGVTIMTHGDDKGMVFPPQIAPIQVIIVPIWNKKSKGDILNECYKVEKRLKDAGILTKIDDSDGTPGAKYNRWEMMGVPLRIELGLRDLNKASVTWCRRDTGEKGEVETKVMANFIAEMLVQISQNLYERAKAKIDGSIAKPTNFSEMCEALENKKICMIPWCNQKECEEQIKEKTTAKSLCMPVENEYTLELEETTTCSHCGHRAVTTCLFAKSY